MKSESILSKLLSFSLVAGFTVIPACTNETDSSKKNVAREREARLVLESIVQLKQDQLALAELQKAEAVAKAVANDQTIVDLKAANQDIELKKQKIESENAAAREEMKKAAALNDAKINELSAANSAFGRIVDDKEVEIARIKAQLEKSAGNLRSTLEELKGREQELFATKKDLKENLNELGKIKVSLKEKEAELLISEGNLSESKKRVLELLTNPQALSNETEAERVRSEAISKIVTGLTTEKAEILKNLAANEAKLSKLREDLASMSKDLELERFMGMQLFLDNASDEILYAVSDDVLRDHYKLDEGQECLFMLSVGQRVENLRLENSLSIPKIDNLNLIPFRLSFDRLAICKTDGGIQAQKDFGMIYKAAASDSSNRRDIVSARTNDPCSKIPVVIAPASGPNPALGSKFQFMHPLIGSINGMEAIALETGKKDFTLSYLQGRSRTGVDAKDCDELLADNFASPLAHTACRVIKGELQVDEKVSMGCFTEEYKNGVVTLKFQN